MTNASGTREDGWRLEGRHRLADGRTAETWASADGRRRSSGPPEPAWSRPLRAGLPELPPGWEEDPEEFPSDL